MNLGGSRKTRATVNSRPFEGARAKLSKVKGSDPIPFYKLILRIFFRTIYDENGPWVPEWKLLRETLERIVRKFRESWFVVNKIYFFIVLLLLSTIKSGLFLIGLIIPLVFYIRGIIKAKIPIVPNGTLHYLTYKYKEIGNTVLKMDVWYPNQIRDAYPLVFFAHGGGWISGFRNQPNNVSWCKFLASKGFATASVDYRLAMRNSMKDILTDYGDALDFIKNNAEKLRINKDDIVLMGLSAGGHLALLYASYYTFMNDETKMQGIKGVSVYYSPSDLRDIFAKEQKSLFARLATMATLKGMPDNKPGLYYYYSPIEWISERMIPTIVVHGKKDMVVPYTSSINLVRKLKSKNIPCRFLLHKEGGHGFETHLKDFQTVRILEETVRFMKRLVS
jgi:acetyl esterase/lipase